MDSPEDAIGFRARFYSSIEAVDTALGVADMLEDDPVVEAWSIRFETGRGTVALVGDAHPYLHGADMGALGERIAARLAASFELIDGTVRIGAED